MGKIITIGELLLRLTPAYHERLNAAKTFQAFYGGAEANVGMSLSKFGHDVHFLSVLPDNDIGDAAISHLAGGGVNTSLVFRKNGRLGTYYYEDGYSLKQAKVIYDRYHSAFHHLANIDINWAAVYKDVDVLHITGITPALSEEMKVFTFKALDEAKKHQVTVSFDFNYRGKLWKVEEAKHTFQEVLPFVDICFASYKDFVYILEEKGSDSFNEQDLARLYKSYAQKFNIKAFASTNRVAISAKQHKIHGYFYQNQQLFNSRVYSFDVLERIGGGDAFAAGVLHGILSNKNADEIVEFGTAAGVLKHMVKGDYNQYTVNEIHSFLQNQEGDVSR